MSTGSQTSETGAEGSGSDGDVHTYRGRTVEELIPRIRAELGPGAIILRERQGLSGGLGGFFAQRCVEIEAQAAPRVNVLADDGDEADAVPAAVTVAVVATAVDEPDAAAEVDEVDAIAELDDVDEELELDDAAFAAASAPTFAARLQAAAGVPSGTPEPAPAPDPGHFRSHATERKPVVADGFIAFDELVDEAPPAPAPPAPPAPPPAASAFRASATEASPRDRDGDRVIEIPIPISFHTPAAPARVPEPPAVQTPQPPAFEPTRLIHRLIERGLSPAFAEALVADARDRDPGIASEPALAVAVRDRLIEGLPGSAQLPLAGGAIAVVGPGGAGKTRAVAGLASALARAGHPVSVARLGSPERALELAELLRDEPVEVLPAMRTRATARAVASARERSLVIVDTTAARSGDNAAVEVLTETLAPFALDGVLLTVPATYTARAAERLAIGYGPLAPTGLIVTRLDESEDLGAVAELSIRHGIPAGFGHAGLEVADAVMALEPTAVAQSLLR